MTPSDKRELLRELEATKEEYVREKLVCGGYETWQVPVVEYWLRERERLRDQERADQLHTVQVKSSWWTKARAAVGIGAVAVPFVIQWMTNHHVL